MSKTQTSRRSKSKGTRELDVLKRADGTTPEQYIVRKINRIILELNEDKKVRADGTPITHHRRRIEVVGNLYAGQIRFIRKVFGITPHSSLPLSNNGYYRCFFWVRKETPLADIPED